ncbi:MAG TPA: VOC family protein [Novosphingobium sp.]
MITALDHLVLTVTSIDETCAFYRRVLGLHEVHYGRGRRGLALGMQRINLHQAGHELAPGALAPTPGSADLCVISAIDLAGVARHLAAEQVPIVHGPVERTGAAGTMHSLYIRDPDGNLIEIAQYPVRATGEDDSRETGPDHAP